MTSGKDRTTQLGKILQLKDNIALLWGQLSAEQAAEPVEPMEAQATGTVNKKVIVWL